MFRLCKRSWCGLREAGHKYFLEAALGVSRGNLDGGERLAVGR